MQRARLDGSQRGRANFNRWISRARRLDVARERRTGIETTIVSSGRHGWTALRRCTGAHDRRALAFRGRPHQRPAAAFWVAIARRKLGRCASLDRDGERRRGRIGRIGRVGRIARSSRARALRFGDWERARRRGARRERGQAQALRPRAHDHGGI